MSVRGSAVWDPPADPAAVEAVAGRAEAAGLAVERARPLGPLTSLGVGGPAAVFVTAPDPAGLRALMDALAPTDPAQVPVLVVGKGSNLLVSDAGFPGLALRLGAGFKWLARDGEVVNAGAGEAMPALAAWAAQEGLTGLEFGAGIPATVGGCVRMNAGAHGGQTGDSLSEVEVETPGGVIVLYRDALEFGYRTSSLPPRGVVTRARWRLRPDAPARIRERLDEVRAWRRQTQPLRERNCGSVFTNPPGDSAGRLVEAAGLKGLAVGGARVSRKHANFIVVDPGALAVDVHALIGLVQRQVTEWGGQLLVPEVRIVGRFPGAGDGDTPGGGP
jgi:UDP-N-acetylmuramate dehydrogenase